MKNLIRKSLVMSLAATAFILSFYSQAAEPKTAVFAGGCFWCIEADFEKLEGVSEVVSGYSGGAADTADYKTVTYTETGHYEAVKVTYDPDKVSYAQLVEYFWRHIDPTDPRGQFCDKGSSYRSAIFYDGDAEKEIVETSLANLKKNKPFDGEIVTAIYSAKPFYLAEEYHQDYYKKNPIRYRFYRNGCKRDARVKELWGKKK
ncbi:MAG: peptide-methionine (S)-S-oxide reductase MsrA [Acidiferrobacterales bacterium]|nr:peptide-methionine (S)-S-oxide reductase MsrA [Acidiferrobacterales bacterium]